MNKKIYRLDTFHVVSLEGIKEDSDYSEFINDIYASANVFGDILVKEDLLTGDLYEAVTGVIIPAIEINNDDYYKNMQTTYIPETPYRAKYRDVQVTRELVDHYYEYLSNDLSFKKSLLEFIRDSKSINSKRKSL